MSRRRNLPSRDVDGLGLDPIIGESNLEMLSTTLQVSDTGLLMFLYETGEDPTAESILGVGSRELLLEEKPKCRRDFVVVGDATDTGVSWEDVRL